MNPTSPLPSSPKPSALQRAVLASAVVALGGCGLLGGSSHEEKAELKQVEETISKVRRDTKTAPDPHMDAAELDAALTKQPGLASKLTTIKSGGELKTPEKSPEPKAAAPKAAVPKTAAATPKGDKSEPPKCTEAIVAPAEKPVEAKLAAKDPAPKVEPAPKVTSNAAVVAMSDTPARVITAMGAMNAAATAEDPGVAKPDALLPMESILGQLRRQVQANPRQLNLALALQLLEMDAKPTAPDAALNVLPEADQKLVGDLTAAVQTMMQQPLQPNQPLAERAAPLLAASTKWQAEADLRLPRMVLASRVDSFGVYSAVEPKFENGKRHTVIIYCEVANFATKKSDDGWFTTRLAQQDSLITEDGLLVWRPNPEEVEDRSRNQRHDFYLVKKLTLPESLAIGKYTLRMSVTDKQSNKIAMVTIPVEIVGK